MHRRRLAAVLTNAVIALAAAAAEDRDAATQQPRRLAEVTAVGNLAGAASGRTALVIDATRRGIVAVEGLGAKDATVRVREVVSPPTSRQGLPVAIGSLRGDVVAAVCRAGDEWDVRTYRIRTGGAADFGHPEARVPLGNSGGAADRVELVVSGSRDWLAVTGLPLPLPTVVRGVFAGTGLRLLPGGDRADDDDARPVAATVSPADELVLFEAVGDAAARVVFLAPSGRTLLRLDTGLTNVRAAAFDRVAGRLWVAAGRPARLWRLDAEMRDGEQAVRATPVGPDRSADLLGLIGGPGESLVVLEGGTPQQVLRLDIREGEIE